jgi:hypothetical protein
VFSEQIAGGMWRLGTDVVGEWLVEVIGRHLNSWTYSLVALVSDYVDDSALFWICQEKGSRCTMKLMGPSCQTICVIPLVFQKLRMLGSVNDGTRRQFSYGLRRPTKSTIVTHEHDFVTGKVFESTMPWHDIYLSNTFGVDGAPDLLLGVEMAPFIPAIVHVFNISTRKLSSTLRFEPGLAPVKCSVARVDTKTGDILIAGQRINDTQLILWRQKFDSTIKSTIKFLQVSTSVSISNSGVFLAANFFGAVCDPSKSTIYIWTYSGRLLPPLPAPDDDSRAYFVPLIDNDTIYYLRYCNALGTSFWCKYRPLQSINFYGPHRDGLPQRLPDQLLIAGLLIVEYYNLENLVVLTPTNNLVSHTPLEISDNR